MDLILEPEAARAEDIADILSNFRQHDLPRNQDITAAISALNNLSWALRELQELIDQSDGRLSRTFADDLELIQQSVAFTLQDVWSILGRMPEACIRRDYQTAWDEICIYSRQMGKQSFVIRLESYKLFLFSLCKVLRKEFPAKSQFDTLRIELLDLRRIQLEDRRLITATEALQELTVVPISKPVKQRSYERQRSPRPASPLTPTSPTASLNSWDALRTARVPTPPASPTTTFSTLSKTSSTTVESNHWASKIFNDMSATPLESNDDTNLCTPQSGYDSKNWPSGEYREILRIKMPSSFRVVLFFRERDYKAKIACQWRDDRDRTRYSSNYVRDLHLRRTGPSLYLCRPVGKEEHVSWCRLKFTTIEWLVIFVCTFLSIRGHEEGARSNDFMDFEQKGEERLFAGAIRDNGYRHALRIYRDRRTKAIRLQASALGGPMNLTPIWTAFITHCMQSRTWYRQRKNVIYLSELRRHVFSADYKPHLAANGEHVLQFDHAEGEDSERAIHTACDMLTQQDVLDADDFVKKIDDLVDSSRSRR